MVKIGIDDLSPLFYSDGSGVYDFKLRDFSLITKFSEQVKLKVTQNEKTKCLTGMFFTGGGDLWDGTFGFFHLLTPGGEIMDFKAIQGSYGSDSLPLVVQRDIKNLSLNVQGYGDVTENGWYRITVKRAGN